MLVRSGNARKAPEHCMKEQLYDDHHKEGGGAEGESEGVARSAIKYM